MKAQKNFGVLNNRYTLSKVIGTGGTSTVYLSTVPDPTDSKKMKDVAIKVLNTKRITGQEAKLLSAEYSTMTQIDNPNIIKMYGIGRGNLVADDKIKENLPYAILEYAEKGDLFNYVIAKNKSGFDEPYSRAIFKGLLNGIQACHAAGFCHRDIKMENIMVDKEYNVKLCDFGFATCLEGKNKDGLLYTPCGTQIYKAPELWMKIPYNGIKSDVFALGVTLFALITGKVPFDYAAKGCFAYHLIMAKLWPKYWQRMNRANVFPNGISKEFKDLFEKMVAFDPRERPIIDDILKHPWFSLPTATKEELIAELKEREGSIPPTEVNISETTATDEGTSACYRGDDDFIQYFTNYQKIYEDKFMLQKENCIVIKGNQKPFEIFTKYANIINKNQNVSITSHKNKLKFNIVFNDEKEEEEEEEIEFPEIEGPEGFEDTDEQEQLQIAIRFNLTDNGKTQFINFQKKSGNKIAYLRKINELKELADEL